jgi:transcription elongation factor GreA
MASTSTAGARAADDVGSLVTADVRERLERQLDELRALKSEIGDRMRAAARDADGQLAIREEEAVLDTRVTALERLLERARVVDAADVDEGLVVLGVTVELRDEDSGHVGAYLLAGMHEASGAGAMSVGSPVGRAVLGRRPGETVEVELPGGRSRRLTVLSSRIAPLDGDRRPR